WLFFFSSRRRHTSFSRDWSSDVCSSDLVVRSCLHLQYFALEQRIQRLDECARRPRPMNALPRRAAAAQEQVERAADMTVVVVIRSEERRVGEGWRRQWTCEDDDDHCALA